MNTSFVVIGLLAFLSGGPQGYEEPAHDVIEKYDDFEVRHYASRVVARTNVGVDFDDAGTTAFPVLRDYIAEHEIAMTVPVTQTPAGAAGYDVEFGMPAVLDVDSLPPPTDERVQISTIPERMVAALSYRGDWDRDRYQRHEDMLMAALAREGLQPVGEAVWARYNSPLMIWFLRRNEILVPVEPIYDTRLACGVGNS